MLRAEVMLATIIEGGSILGKRRVVDGRRNQQTASFVEFGPVQRRDVDALDLRRLFQHALARSTGTLPFLEAIEEVRHQFFAVPDEDQVDEIGQGKGIDGGARAAHHHQRIAATPVLPT